MVSGVSRRGCDGAGGTWRGLPIALLNFAGEAHWCSHRLLTDAMLGKENFAQPSRAELRHVPPGGRTVLQRGLRSPRSRGSLLQLLGRSSTSVPCAGGARGAEPLHPLLLCAAGPA